MKIIITITASAAITATTLVAAEFAGAPGALAVMARGGNAACRRG